MKTPSLALWAHRQGFLLSGLVQKYCFIFPEMGIQALVAIAHRALGGALVANADTASTSCIYCAKRWASWDL